METRPKTIICDIDGTLVEHMKPNVSSMPKTKMTLLPGVLDKLVDWDRKGYKIILLTGRKESLRDTTEKQLKEVGIFYDQLVMGVGGGHRVLINDMKDDGSQTAFAINLIRNKGIEEVDL